MRIAFAGTPAVAIPTLKALIESDHEIAVVITQPPAAKGRSKTPIPSDVARFAIDNNLEIFDPVSINSPESITFLKSLNIDLAVVVAYGQLLSTDTLNVFEKGWINEHFSLLPAWRGAAPVQAAIIHGDEVTGVSTFKLEVGMDTGPVFGQVTTEIKKDETAGELLDRLSLLGAELVIRTLSAISTGEAKPTTQADFDVSYAPKLSPTQGQIKWHNPALAIHRHIRGFTPTPGAWSLLDGVRIEIAPIEILDSNDLEPGQMRIDKNAIIVGTGSADIKLTNVKPAGKGWMEASAWARGLRSTSGIFADA